VDEFTSEAEEFTSEVDEFTSEVDEFTSEAELFTSEAEEFASESDEFTSAANEFTSEAAVVTSEGAKFMARLGWFTTSASWEAGLFGRSAIIARLRSRSPAESSRAGGKTTTIATKSAPFPLKCIAQVALCVASACASAPPRPTPVMSPEAAWGLVHFVQALNDPSGTRFDGWSARLVASGPEHKIRGQLADMHQAFGDCELKKVLEGGSVEGEAALRCSRGILTVRWTVEADPPHALQSLAIKDRIVLKLAH